MQRRIINEYFTDARQYNACKNKCMYGKEALTNDEE